MKNGADAVKMNPEELMDYARNLMVLAEQKLTKEQEDLQKKEVEQRQKAAARLEKAKAELEKANRKKGFLLQANPINTADIASLESDLEEAELGIKNLETEIWNLTEALGIKATVVEKKSRITQYKTPAQVGFAISKIVLTVVTLYFAVIKFGVEISEKYPNVAIYNEVNYQKVLFAISVLFTGLGISVISLSLGIPQIAKYLNPFSDDSQTFTNDFPNLTIWQKSIVSVLLFSLFFMAFIFLVLGKLD